MKHLGEKALVFFPSKTDLISITDKNGVTEELLSDRLDTLLSQEGDASNVTVTFQEATEKANIQSGDSLATAFAKLAKFCSDQDRIVKEDFSFKVNNNGALIGERKLGSSVVEGAYSTIGTAKAQMIAVYARDFISNGVNISNKYASKVFLSDILNVFIKKKESRIFKLIYPSSMGSSGGDGIYTYVYPNVGDYFYSSGEKYVSYAGRKVTLEQGWYQIKTDITALDPTYIDVVIDAYLYPLFYHPIVASMIDGFMDPEFITAEENGINSIIQEEERLGNIVFTKQYELKDAPECVKEENQYLGESAYWCPELIEGKAIPKGSIWYINSDANTTIGYYQVKIDIPLGLGHMSLFSNISGLPHSPSPEPYEKLYFEYLGTSYKVYAGMPNSNYKQVERDAMLEEIKEILENHIK